MDIFLFVGIVFIILASLIGYKSLNNIFQNAPNISIFNLFYTGLVINIGLCFFIMFYFKNIKIKSGPQGPKGETGNKGPMGPPDTCIQCEPLRKNLGHKAVQNKKQNTLIVPIPEIPVNLPGRAA